MNNNTTFIQTISERLVANMGADLSPTQRAEYTESAQQLFMARLGVALMEAMSPADRELYQTQFVANNTTNSTSAQEFINSKVPNVEAVLSQEAENFIKEFIKE